MNKIIKNENRIGFKLELECYKDCIHRRDGFDLTFCRNCIRFISDYYEKGYKKERDEE